MKGKIWVRSLVATQVYNCFATRTFNKMVKWRVGEQGGKGKSKLDYITYVQFSLSRAAGAPQESSQANLLVFVNSSGRIIVAISFEISIHFSWCCRHIVTWSFGRRSNVWEVRHTIGGEGLVGFQFEPIQMGWGILQNLFCWDIFTWDSFPNTKLLNVQSIVSFDGASQRNLENAPEILHLNVDSLNIELSTIYIQQKQIIT